MAQIVLIKVLKIHSVAIDEMREEMRVFLRELLYCN